MDNELPLPGSGSGDSPATDAPVTPSADAIKKYLSDLVTTEIVLDVDKEKIYQYSEARKNELYWRGQQYLFPVMVGGQVADWSSTSGTIEYGKPPGERGSQYDYSMNVIRGDGQKFVAVLGQRSPNVKAKARREDSELLIQRVRKADQAAEYLRNTWEVERKQRQLALSLWKNGTTFFYTPWVTDAEKYGIHEEPQFEMQTQEVSPATYLCSNCSTPSDASSVKPGPDGQPTCPYCASPLFPWNQSPAVTGEVPVQTGTKRYAKGTVELHLCTIFEVTLPFYSKGIYDAPWLWYEYEEHKGSLLKAFPELRAKLGSGGEWTGDDSGTSSQGRLTRDTASSPSGAYVAPRKGRWLYQRFWLRPGMYELIENTPIRLALQQQFPIGVKVTRINGEVIKLESEKLDDVWSMAKPGVSEYIFADPICKDYMDVQDLINDMYNLTVETLQRSIPFMVVDPQLFDVNVLSNRRGAPAEMIPAKAGSGAQLQAGIQRAPVSTVDPAIMQWPMNIRDQGRENVGITPPIFGGGGPEPTARAAEIKKDQALQQLNTVWSEMRDGWAGAHLNGVRQLARFSMPDGVNLANFDGDVADFSDLLGGGWHFETEEAMPMTWGQKRDILLYMLQQGPEAWRLFGMENPMNAAQFHEVMGLTGWKVTNEDARSKVLSRVKLLSTQAPVQGAPGTPPQPSIPPDQFEDDHTFVVSMIRQWAQTDDAGQLRERNPEGYSNVIAYGLASMQLAGPPMPPPGTGTPPAPPSAPPGQGPGPQIPINPGAPGAPAPGGAPAGAPPPTQQPGLSGPPGQGPVVNAPH